LNYTHFEIAKYLNIYRLDNINADNWWVKIKKGLLSQTWWWDVIKWGGRLTTVDLKVACFVKR